MKCLHLMHYCTFHCFFLWAEYPGLIPVSGWSFYLRRNMQKRYLTIPPWLCRLYLVCDNESHYMNWCCQSDREFLTLPILKHASQLSLFLLNIPQSSWSVWNVSNLSTLHSRQLCVKQIKKRLSLQRKSSRRWCAVNQMSSLLRSVPCGVEGRSDTNELLSAHAFNCSDLYTLPCG